MRTGVSVTRGKPGVPLTLRNVAIATGCSIGYLLLAAWLIGFKTDQLALVILFNTLFYLSGVTRRFILGVLGLYRFLDPVRFHESISQLSLQ